MTDMDAAIDRRHFLGYLVKGAGLAVALRVGVDLSNPEAAFGDHIIIGSGGGTGDIDLYPEFADEVDLTDLLLWSGDPFYYDYLIAITPENRVRFEVPRMEQGQGIDTAATMIVAEELDVRVDQVDTSLSPAEFRRATGQITGGSHAVPSLWDPLRKVTAQLRTLIVTAAAAEFTATGAAVTPDQVTTRDALAIAPDGREIPYTDLSEGVEGRNDSARTAEPKDPADYRVIGNSYGRLDALDIVTGKVDYAMDLQPDWPVCVVARGPKFGSEVVSFDDSAARNLPGVVDILEVRTDVEGSTSGVAVIARSTGEAFRARDALDIVWSPGSHPTTSDDDVLATLRAVNLPTLPAIPVDGLTVQGEFIFPYMAHAPMETMTAAADADEVSATVWTGAKTPLAAQAKIARELYGIDEDDTVAAANAVTVNVIKSGGSFGRRLFFDAAVEAARISKEAGMPIKLLFTRQDDTAKGRARPLTIHDVQVNYLPGTVLTDPEILSFDHRCAAPQLDLRHGFGDAITALGAEFGPYSYSQTIWHSTQLVPYEVGATSLLLNEPSPAPEPVFPVPTSSWRGIYSGTAQVANEVIIDELARALGEDEVEFRRNRLTDDRSLAVLEKVAAEGPWGRTIRTKPKRIAAQGIGLHKEYKSRAAVLVEVEIDTRQARRVSGGKAKKENFDMRVKRVVVALDVNRVINPVGLENQAIGAIQDAISYVIRTGLHLDDGAIRESSYGDFEVSRMDSSPPEVEIHLMPPNGERPGGAGELVLPAAGAAIANAFARATGIAPRRFPLAEFYKEA